MSLPQVMILGTFHFNNPNADYIKTNYDSILSDQRQTEVRAVVENLARFQPTHVALEFEPSKMEKVNALYTAYQQGEHELRANESEQLGFRLAAQMGHTQVYGVDFRQDMNIEAVMQAASPEIALKFQTMVQQFMEEEQKIHEKSLVEILNFHNNPDVTDAGYALYMMEATIGKTGNYIGADDVGGWYTRNLKIFAEISWLAQSAQDRVLVIIGSGHAVLLRQFARMSSYLKLVDPRDFLT